jgi:Ca2+-binding EF-hand superfamily protein
MDFVQTNQGAKRSLTELYRHLLLEKKQTVVKSVAEHPKLIQFSRQVKKAIFRDPDAQWPPKSAKANVPPVIDVIELNAAINCPHFSPGEISISRGAINAFLEKSAYQPVAIKTLHQGFVDQVLGSNIVCLDATKEGFTKALIVERGTFKSMLGPLFENAENRDQVLAHLYELLDMDYSGAIDASELLVALILFGKGSLNEKLALAFDVFDIDGSQSLDLDEIENLVQTCFLRGLHFTEALFRAYTDPTTDQSVEQVTLYTLSHLDEINNASHNALLEQDADDSGCISKEEFIAWAKDHDLLNQFFSLHEKLFAEVPASGNRQAS